MRLRLPLALASVAFSLAVLASGASASTLVYQCGPAVCAVDPDSADQPRRLTDDGRLAGITADGETASWVQPDGRLAQAPVDGGAPTTVPYEGTVVNQPSMSPDGSQYLWWYPGPDVFGGLTAVYINRLTVGQSGAEGLSYCGGCVTSHGWVGQTPIAAFPADSTGDGEPSKVCRLATEEEEPGVSRSCVQVLASDTRGGIAFPSGNAAGTEVVAAMSPGETTGVAGRIVRYSLATGQPIADVTEGTTDTTPAFSAEGDRVAFERDDQIVIKDLAAGTERVIGPGTYPFWGGSRTDPGAAVSLRSKSLRAKRGKVRLKLACRASSRCTGKVSMAAKRAKVAKGRYSVAAGERGSAKAKLTSRGRALLKRRDSARVVVSLKPKGDGEAVTERLRLRG